MGRSPRLRVVLPLYCRMLLRTLGEGRCAALKGQCATLAQAGLCRRPSYHGMTSPTVAKGGNGLITPWCPLVLGGLQFPDVIVEAGTPVFQFRRCMCRRWGRGSAIQQYCGVGRPSAVFRGNSTGPHCGGGGTCICETKFRPMATAEMFPPPTPGSPLSSRSS